MSLASLQHASVTGTRMAFGESVQGATAVVRAYTTCCSDMCRSSVRSAAAGSTKELASACDVAGRVTVAEVCEAFLSRRFFFFAVFGPLLGRPPLTLRDRRAMLGEWLTLLLRLRLRLRLCCCRLLPPLCRRTSMFSTVSCVILFSVLRGVVLWSVAREIGSRWRACNAYRKKVVMRFEGLTQELGSSERN